MEAMLTYRIGLVKHIGLKQTILLEYLLNESDKIKGKTGWFSVTQKDITEGTGLSREQTDTALKRLKSVGVIITDIAGNPPRRYFYINREVDLVIAGALMRKGSKE